MVGGELQQTSGQGEPIDIILLTHGRLRDLTIPCVSALYANTRNLFHLIIMDDSTPDMDGGTDTTPHWAKLLQIDNANVTYVHSEIPYKTGNEIINKGLPYGNNRFVVVMGNSTIVEPDWDIVPVKMLQQDRKIGVVGVKSLKLGWSPTEDGQIESAGVNFYGYQPCDIGRDKPGHQLSNSYPCQSIQWACIFTRREAITGNLESHLYQGHVGWDDLDNTITIRSKGWEAWYCGSSVVYHRTHATRGSDKYEILYKNRVNQEIYCKRWGWWQEFKDKNVYSPSYFQDGEVKFICDALKIPLTLTDEEFDKIHNDSSSKSE